MNTVLPENEAERLNALRRYQILDTPPDLCESVGHGEFTNPAELVRATSRLPFANRVGAQSCRGMAVFDAQGRGFSVVCDIDDEPKLDRSARPRACARRLYGRPRV